MELYYVGTKFELEANTLGLQTYMLTECFNADSVFAVVSITGYYSGRIYGYIREQPELAETHVAVTEEHLKKQLEVYCFMDINWSSFRIIEK